MWNLLGRTKVTLKPRHHLPSWRFPPTLRQRPDPPSLDPPPPPGPPPSTPSVITPGPASSSHILSCDVLKTDEEDVQFNSRIGIPPDEDTSLTLPEPIVRFEMISTFVMGVCTIVPILFLKLQEDFL